MGLSSIFKELFFVKPYILPLVVWYHLWFIYKYHYYNILHPDDLRRDLFVEE